MKLDKIFQALTPKERKFYPLFEASADNALKAAILLNRLFLVKDFNERKQIIQSIRQHEQMGDDLTHRIFDELNTTFITPFDREDIHSLNSRLDDVMDYIDESGRKMVNHPPLREPFYLLEISEFIIMACREMSEAVKALNDLRKHSDILRSCRRIREVEHKADETYHLALSELFRQETDAIELIKIKDILYSLEKATDCTENVAGVIKSILVKFGRGRFDNNN
jgi:uncharacterized protein